MSTPREKFNQIVINEIDAFATKMKEMVEYYELSLKANERLRDGLARELDRRMAGEPLPAQDRVADGEYPQ